MSQRFMDDFTRFNDFGPEVSIICPRRRERSTLQHRGSNAAPRYVLTCGHCGFSDQRTKEPVTWLSCHKLHGADFEPCLPLNPEMDLCVQCHKR